MSEETGSVKSKGVMNSIGRYVGLAINWFEVIVLSGGTAMLAIMLIANVIARSFFQSIYFAEEVSKLLIILITMAGVSYAARKARHIRMGAFFDLMPPRVEKIFVFIISGFNAVVLFLLAYYSYRYVLQMKMTGQTTAALQIPFWTFNLIVPIAFALSGIQYIRTIIKNIVEKDVWLSPEQQSEYEDELPIEY